MKKTKKRSARERRVLIVALLVAAAIVAGSTFAWFTSKDEVTNRLSASARYDVSIAEDFQPHEDWIPGQDINKDVSAVNTGSVDAFVRMWMEGEMSVVNSTQTEIPEDNNVIQNAGLLISDSNLKTVTDRMKDLGYALYKGTGNNTVYYRVLSTEKRKNPDDVNTASSDPDPETNQAAKFSEVQTVQAGGYLVAAPANAKWYYTAEQQTEIVNNATPTNQTVIVPKGTVIGSSAVAAGDMPTGITLGVNLNAKDNCKIDSDTFKPITPGLYIFRRVIDLDGTAAKKDTFEYSGYIYYNDGTNEYYFALSPSTITNSDYVLPSGAVTVNTTDDPQSEALTYTVDTDNIKLDTAKETIVENGALKWEYDNTTPKLTATYDGGTPGATDALKADDIIIDVTLANIGTDAQQWTCINASGNKNTFYYNDDLEAGDTTTKLVDKVTLNAAVTEKAFLAFDFDLNVFLESVQVTMDEDGKETTVSVNTWAATTDSSSNAINTGAAPVNGNTAKTYDPATEIKVVGWQ